MGKIVIDPVTRIEGHLKIEVEIGGGKATDAKASGTMFRGFEIFLKGRSPLDAPIITQRVCGVCPIAHSTASALALDDALGIKEKIPANGRTIRNVIFGSNFIQSHILHFYHLAALDFVDVAAAADYDGSDPDLVSLKAFLKRGALEPFVPRHEGAFRLSKDDSRRLAAHYIEALKIRRLAHEMLAIFGGKMPHNCGIVPGGASSGPSLDKMASILGKLKELREFIDNRYIGDVLTVARAYPEYFSIGKSGGGYLSYGGMPLEKGTFFQAGVADGSLSMPEAVDASKLSESVARSWFDDSCGAAPAQGRTVPAVGKAAGYSWLKAPRYDGKPCEVGPLARVLVGYAGGVGGGASGVKKAVDAALGELKARPEALFSVLGRHAARAIECKLVADALDGWVLSLKPGEPHCAEFKIPEEAAGMGLTEAPRGSLGHWVKIEGKKIANYQLVVPTTWNASPRDEKGTPGPMEQAILGTKVASEASPVEVMRIVRSFDPCLACAVHAVSVRGAR